MKDKKQVTERSLQHELAIKTSSLSHNPLPLSAYGLIHPFPERLQEELREVLNARFQANFM